MVMRISRSQQKTSSRALATPRACVTPSNRRRVSSSPHKFSVAKDVRLNNVKTTTRLQVPRYKNLDGVCGIIGEPGQEGQIILNREDQLFYGHEGNKWQFFANTEIINGINDEIVIINDEIVVINNDIDVLEVAVSDNTTFIEGTRDLIGFGTQVDIGGLDDFIDLDPIQAAPNFIALLSKFGFSILQPPPSNDDIKVARRFQRLGNNINVDGSVSIRVGIESSLYVTIILLQMIELMPIIETMSLLIVTLLDDGIFDVNTIINAFTILGTEINALLTNPLTTVPFNLPTISEKFLNDNSCVNVQNVQFIVSDQTFIGDCGGSVLDLLPQIGKGSFSKLRVDILVNELQSLLAVEPASIPNTITIPTSEFGPIIETVLQTIIDSIQVIIDAFASSINSVIIAPINNIINAINDSILNTDFSTLENVAFGDIPGGSPGPPPAVNIPDVDIPLNGLPVADIVNIISDVIIKSIELLTLTLGVHDISYDIFTEPGDKEIRLDFFTPLSSQLITRLYDVIKEVISVVNIALGDFKIPLEIIRSFASLVVFIIQTFTIGETHFSYTYRCNPDQIPGLVS